MTRIPLTLSLVCAALITTACGGGGSSSTDGPPPTGPGGVTNPNAGSGEVNTSFSALNAWKNLLSVPATREWQLDGRSADNVDYRLTLRIEPPVADVFPVTPTASVKRINLSNLIDSNGTPIQQVQNEQFVNDQFFIVGTRVTSGAGTPAKISTCSKPAVTASLPLPLAGTELSGALYPLYAGLTLTDCTPSAIDAGGKAYNQWSVVAEAGITYFCVATRDTPVNTPINQLSETCIEINTAGELLSRARITLKVPGSLDLVARTAL